MPTRKLAPAIAAGLLMMLCLAFSTINAQETQNGMETRTPRKISDPVAGPSLMGPVPTSGPWIEFSFFATGSAARGCSPADAGGPGCGPSSGGNSVFGSLPPWTFTAPAGGANLTVTDAFLRLAARPFRPLPVRAAMIPFLVSQIQESATASFPWPQEAIRLRSRRRPVRLARARPISGSTQHRPVWTIGFAMT
jgi:hypothetical protein